MSTAQAVLDQALRHHRDGRLDEAIRTARLAIDAAPNDASYRVTLAKMLVAAGDAAGAAAAYEEALALAPEDRAAWLSLGFLRHELGDIDAALAAYGQAFPTASEETSARELLLENAQRGLFFGVGSGFQGAHAPERQVFMSAAVSLLRDRPAPIAILEIGSYLGASALTWIRAIERLTGLSGRVLCVDTWTGRHLDDDFVTPGDPFDAEMARYLAGSDTAYRIFQKNIATAPDSVSIAHRRGASAEIVPQLDAASFDLVYIDGSHRYDDVAADIRNADRVVRDGGFVCGDDLELQMDQCDLDYARAHPQADFVADPLSGGHFHPGVTVAVGERFGRVSAYSGFWIMQKTAAGYHPVDLRLAEGLLPLHWPRRTVDALRTRFASSGELRRVLG